MGLLEVLSRGFNSSAGNIQHVRWKFYFYQWAFHFQLHFKLKIDQAWKRKYSEICPASLFRSIVIGHLVGVMPRHPAVSHLARARTLSSYYEREKHVNKRKQNERGLLGLKVCNCFSFPIFFSTFVDRPTLMLFVSFRKTVQRTITPDTGSNWLIWLQDNMARPVLKSIISFMLSLDISMNSKWPIYPHFVCRSCPTVFTYFPRSKVNPECEDHLYLMKHSETATFCRKILRFRGFLRCGFVVNNLKSLSSDWPIYGGVSLPLSAKTMHNWLLFAGVFHEL